MMKYSTIPAAQLLVIMCKKAGIKDIVISPGSRNAPLILSFTGDPFFNCYSIVDERCAAFYALGIGQQINAPVALVCTSGSALLNYYPAIAEAFYSDIPLVVISADRPPYKIDVGDGQTIRQDNVYDRHIGFSANLKIDVAHAEERLRFYAPKYLEQTQEHITQQNAECIQNAFAIAFTKKQPIHINIPFEEPLYGLGPLEDEIEKTAIVKTAKISLKKDFSIEKAIWNTSQKKMVLVGVHPPHTIAHQLLEKLARDPSVLVFTETTSNLHHPNFFPSIDSILFPIEKSKNPDIGFSALQPDILLTFGGLVVSKKIKEFLRKYKPKRHWHIHPTKALNTYFSNLTHFKSEASLFLETLYENSESVESNYFKEWNKIKLKYQKSRDEYLKTVPFSDFKAFAVIQKAIPTNYQVQLSNSSTIRYTQLFPMDASLQVYCNRGTSGIDGSTSTAIGASLYCNNPTLLITGDLSFFYDSNALWNNYIRSDLRIIVINNSGGGIFRILPGFDSSERFASFFETQHHLTAELQCKQFGLAYSMVKQQENLTQELKYFFEPSSQPKLLEIFTPTELNNRILLGYFDFISSGK